jgi:uncharacterized protein YfbU (UPF0304 family)
MKNEEQIKKILDDLLCKEARKEALIILSKASDTQMKEFLAFYSQKKENTCCMVLDSIKMKLVESGDMKMRDDDWFGHPIWE